MAQSVQFRQVKIKDSVTNEIYTVKLPADTMNLFVNNPTVMSNYINIMRNHSAVMKGQSTGNQAIKQVGKLMDDPEKVVLNDALNATILLPTESKPTESKPTESKLTGLNIPGTQPSLPSVQRNMLEDRSPPSKRVDQKMTPSKESFTTSSPAAPLTSRRKLNDNFGNLSIVPTISKNEVSKLMPEINSKGKEEIRSGSRKLLNEVQVKGLPSEYSKDILLYIINNEYRSKYPNSDDVALKISEVAGNIHVQFSSVDTAQKASKLVGVKYRDNTLILQHLSMKEFTDEVQVNGLPSSFSKEVLLYIINNEYRSEHQNSHDVALKISEVAGNIHVQFSSVDTAQKASELVGVKYKDNTLILQHLELFDSTPDSTPDSPPIKEFIDEVLVKGLPSPFSKDVLLYIINTDYKSEYENTTDDVALKVLEVAGNIHVQFSSVDTAQNACQLFSVMYKDSLLTLSHVELKKKQSTELEENKVPSNCNISQQYWDSDEEESPHEVAKKNSRVVRLSHIPSHVKNESGLHKFVDEAMQEACFSDCKCVKKISLFDREKRSAIVEFETCEEANLATLLQKGELRIVKYVGPKDTYDDDTPLQSLALNSEQATLIFIKLLVKNRGNFPKNGSHASILTHLQRKMVKKSVYASVHELQRKRRNLLETFKKSTREGRMVENHRLLKVAFGDGDISSVADDLSESDDDDSGLEVTFPNSPKKSANWTHNTTKALIDTCIIVKKRSVPPWKFFLTVHKEMTLLKLPYSYTMRQCEERVKSLTARFKDYFDGGSGAEGPLVNVPEPERQIMHLMAEYMDRNVTVEPKLCISAGLKKMEESSDKKTKDVQRGRSRPAVLQRQSASHRKLDALEGGSKALQLIAKSMARKNQVSDNDDE